MKDKETVAKLRLDKYLWAIRLFKTRSMAAHKISSGKVKFINGQVLKSSYLVKVGDQFKIEISKDNIKIIKVVDLLEKRMSAEFVKPYYEDLSPPTEKKEILPSVFVSLISKSARGSGRPTKKDRRDLGEIGYF